MNFFFSSRRRHTISLCDWSSDVCSSDLFPGGIAGWLVPWCALAVISALDDVRAVAVSVRLCVHALAALWTASWLWLYSEHAADAGAASALIAIAAMAFVITWASNLYNFMDGNDGLCATM